jgi:hypothetical protein
MEFPASTSIVILTAVEVAGSAGIVTARERVLGGGPFLDEEFPPTVEEQDVNGAVPELPGVNLSAGGLANHTILVVNNVKDLRRVLHGDGVPGIRGKEKPPERVGGLL